MLDTGHSGSCSIVMQVVPQVLILCAYFWKTSIIEAPKLPRVLWEKRVEEHERLILFLIPLGFTVTPPFSPESNLLSLQGRKKYMLMMMTIIMMITLMMTNRKWKRMNQWSRQQTLFVPLSLFPYLVLCNTCVSEVSWVFFFIIINTVIIFPFLSFFSLCPWVKFFCIMHYSSSQFL